MNATWLKQTGACDLIVVFGGWGLGPEPFSALSGPQDILFFDDYRHLDAPAPSRATYTSFTVFSYSFGVASALHWLESTGFFPDRLIAVNGTPYPADAERGIAPDMIAATANNLTDASFSRFCRRAGLTTPATLDIAARQEELRAIANRGSAKPRKFDRIWISSKDRIIPTHAQRTAWADQSDQVQEIDAQHMPFAGGQSWEGWLT
ncbi:DUF452 family protein [Aliiroseovarius sp. KMU-50]|uniref:DUF452 family protein n=1 Tax=Aliiroseovarius salicola TaxID=3009082 RepID=A0ABT4W468_9RHOB|nr:pimeloyl-ACP methyl esterase BioG family protein [Aliiroseovarius sp. KMU-50]MDA5095325.1 DUF452 family protein [Aliiroseovarius sp. KMU-50]